MKTFVINQLKKVSDINRRLDIVSTLMKNAWLVFDDNIGKTEKFIFMSNGKLLIAVDGVTSTSTWQYLAADSSIVIEDKLNNYLLNVVVCDKNIVVLKLDGTQQYCFLLRTDQLVWSQCDYEAIQNYLFLKCGVDILSEEQRLRFESLKREEELQRIAEKKARKKEKQELMVYYLIIIGIIVIMSVIMMIGANSRW